MTTTITVRFQSDPYHGWLVMPKASLAQVGLTEADISTFSYQNGDTIALEEDADAHAFFSAAKGRQAEIVIKEDPPVNGDSPIRSWRRFGTKARVPA